MTSSCSDPEEGFLVLDLISSQIILENRSDLSTICFIG